MRGRAVFLPVLATAFLVLLASAGLQSTSTSGSAATPNPFSGFKNGTSVLPTKPVHVFRFGRDSGQSYQVWIAAIDSHSPPNGTIAAITYSHSVGFAFSTSSQPTKVDLFINGVDVSGTIMGPSSTRNLRPNVLRPRGGARTLAGPLSGPTVTCGWWGSNGNGRGTCPVDNANIPYTCGAVTYQVEMQNASGKYFSQIDTAYYYNGNACHPQTNCDECNAAQSVSTPVDLATGKLWYTYDDMPLSGPFGFDFSRYYDNQSGYSADMGKGWRHSYGQFLDLSQYLSPNANTLIVYYDNTGKRDYFAGVTGTGSYYDNLSGDRLILNSSGPPYTLVTWQNVSYNFDSAGRLSSIADRYGNTQTISRDAQNRISSVTDPLNRQITFSYDASNRVSSVTSFKSISSGSNPNGITISFGYDSGTNCTTGQLCSATEPDGKKWTYQYDSNNNLAAVIDPNGNAEEQNTFVYNSNEGVYQVATQYTTTIGGVKQDYLSFSYPFPNGPYETDITDALNRVSRMYVDSTRWLVTLRQGAMCDCGGSISMNYTYDQLGRLASSYDGNNSTTALSYGEDTVIPGVDIVQGVPSATTITRSGPSVTTQTYNFGYGNVGSNTQDLVTSFSYPSVDTAGMTATTTINYNPNATPSSILAQGYVNGTSTTYTTNYTFDTMGRILTISGPRTDVTQTTTFGYFTSSDTSDLPTLGQLKSITRSVNSTLNLVWKLAPSTVPAPYNTYEVHGLPRAFLDPNSVQQRASYDAVGRLTSGVLIGVIGGITNPTTTLSYDAAGRQTKLKWPLSNALTFGFDTSNRLTALTRLDSLSKQNERVFIAYDAASQLTQEQAQACTTPSTSCASWVTAQQDSFSYDTYSRLGTVTHPIPSPSPATFTFQYDYGGNVHSTIDENSNLRSFGHDGLNRMTSAGPDLGAAGTLALGYDTLDNLTSANISGNGSIIYSYDDFGRAKTQVSVNTGTTSYQYDADNNIDSISYANNASATYTYDALDRPLTETSTHNGTEAVTWTYDDQTAGHYGLGRLATMTDPTGQTTYTYDLRGFVSTESHTVSGHAYSLAYSYDANGNRTSVQYPSGRTVTYGFDFADRATSAVSGSTTYVSSAGYAPFGPLTQLVYGNGTTRNTTYDLRYRITENKLINTSTQAAIADFLYQEDLYGNITQIHDALYSNYNRDFTYDSYNALSKPDSGTALWGSNQGKTYHIDTTGNITYLPIGAQLSGFQYTAATSLLTQQQEGSNPWTTVTEDASGNETAVGAATYTYSPRNLLSGGDGLTYGYDALRRRTITSGTTGSRYSFYSPESNLVSETAVASGTPTDAYDYVWFAGMPVAQEDVGGSTHWTFDDHLATPIVQTTSTQVIYWQADYKPNGEIFGLRAGAGVHQPLRYPGMEAEQFAANGINGDTARFYNAFRWYRPHWERYTQPDPVGLAGGVNPYEYAQNNPIALTDPLGLDGLPLQYEPFQNRRSVGRTLPEGSGNPSYHSDVENRPTALSDPLNLGHLTAPTPVGPIWCPNCREFGVGTLWFWLSYERMKVKNWQFQDQFYHCMANCLAVNVGPGGRAAANFWDFLRTGYTRFIKREPDWQEDVNANVCGKKGGDCVTRCKRFVPKSRKGNFGQW
jgi:RHS repeat-associated protein